MKNGLEVFDFQKEDELPECAAGDYFSKFENPNMDGSATPKFDLLGNGEFTGFGSKEGGSGMLVFSKPRPTTSQQQNDLDEDNYVHRSLFPEVEPRDSCPRESLTWRSQLNSALSNSPSSYESVEEPSDADESMGKSSPSTPGLHGTEDDVPVGGYMSDNCLGNVVLDNVNKTVSIYPDFLLYCGNYCAGSVVIFSHGGIKFESSATRDDGETFGFQKGVNDIVEIGCQWSQRAGYILFKLQVLSEDTVEGGNSEGLTGTEEVEFSVYEPNWFEKQEAITSLNEKFLVIWDAMVEQEVGMDGHDSHKCYFPNFDEPFEEVIYPKEDADAVAISKRDVDLLQPETFINDTIIDFYIKYLKNQIPPEDRQRFHFFNSFFFRKLADLDKDPSSISDGRAAYLRVHKWTRKVDLFGKDYIFIPVNFNLHWSLIVLCHPGEVAGIRDEDTEKSPKVPCILHMDSIRGTHAGLKNLVQRYLWEEWKGRHKDTSEDLSSRFLNLRFVSLELPQQENSFDCGLFLLHYLELFLVEAPTNFNPFKITEVSNFLYEDWFLPTEAYLKRTLIQKLIFELLEARHQEIMSTECSDEQESPKFLGKNETVTGIEFLSQRCSTEIACHANLPNSQAGQGIEMTLLEPSSMRKLHSDNDSSMVLRDLFEPGDGSGTLLGQFQSFDHPSSYYDINGAISPGEREDVEDGAGFAYLASRENNFQQLTETAVEACSAPYSSRALMMDASWNPGISIQEQCNINTYAETSCASHDDDVGIIEIKPGVEMELGEKGHMDQQRSPLLEMEFETEGNVSASCNLAMAIGADACPGPDRVQDGNKEDGNFSLYEENSTLLLQSDPSRMMNQLGMEFLTCGTEASEDAGGMQNGNEDGNFLPPEDNSAMLQRDPGMVNRLGLDSKSEMVVLTRSTEAFEESDRMQNGTEEDENSAVLLRQDLNTAVNRLGPDTGNQMMDLTLGTEVSKAFDRMQNFNKDGDLLPSEENPTMLLRQDRSTAMTRLGPDPDSGNKMVELTLGTEVSEAVDRMRNGNEDGNLKSSEENPTILLRQDPSTGLNQLGIDSGSKMVELTLGTEVSEGVDRMQNGHEDGVLPPSEDNQFLQQDPSTAANQLDLTCGTEVSEAFDTLQNGNEDGDCPPSEDNPTMLLRQNSSGAVNRSSPDSEIEIVVFTRRSKVPKNVHVLLDGKKDNKHIPSEENQTMLLEQDSDLMANKEAGCGGDLLTKSDMAQLAKRTRCVSLDEAGVDSQNPVISDQCSELLENKDTIRNAVQMIEDSLPAKNNELHPAKKIRFMSPNEAEEDSRKLRGPDFLK